ncbi:unnamed protein product [Cunninghamella echinulata]
MELAHAALEEATKEEDAKGVLQELLERFLARTGAPLMAGAIADQLRSQEVIEQLAEQSFERQRRLLQHSLKQNLPSTSSTIHNNINKSSKHILLATDKVKKPSSLPITLSSSSSTTSSITLPTSTLLPQEEKSIKPNKLLSNNSNNGNNKNIKKEKPSSSPPLLPKQHSTTTKELSSSSIATDNNMDETVIRDHFVIQDSSSTMTHNNSPSSTERLLLISEYMWRVFRLLLLGSIITLIYHYVCAFPQHQVYF